MWNNQQFYNTRRFGPRLGGGLVAFSHQMGALWAPWLVKLKFGALGTPLSSSCGGLNTECSPENFVKI